MTTEELENIFDEAVKAEETERAISALDQWESSQVRSRETLQFLRYHRQRLCQYDVAALLADEMLSGQHSSEAERMCDYLTLAKIQLQRGASAVAWGSLQNVYLWKDLPKWYSVGLARDAIERALDVSLASDSGQDLRLLAFESAVRLIDAGSSTSYVILSKAVQGAIVVGDTTLQQRFQHLANVELAECERHLNGDYGGTGE